MKILVTGGAGFIGPHVVDRYLAAGLDFEATATLTVRTPDGEVRGVTLGDDAGTDYEIRWRPIVADHLWWITGPTGFRWVQTDEGTMPDYTSGGQR